MLQVFAWGKMITTYSRTMSLKSAVRLTFTPTNMCEICQLVKSAKASEDPSRGTVKSPERPLVIQIRPSLFVAAPLTGMRVPLPEADAISNERLAPPLPPPRGIAV